MESEDQKMFITRYINMVRNIDGMENFTRADLKNRRCKCECGKIVAVGHIINHKYSKFHVNFTNQVSRSSSGFVVQL